MGSCELPQGSNLVLFAYLPFLLPLFCLFLIPVVFLNLPITWAPHSSDLPPGEGHGAGGRAWVKRAGTDEPLSSAVSFLGSFEAGRVDLGSPSA